MESIDKAIEYLNKCLFIGDYEDNLKIVEMIRTLEKLKINEKV